MKLKELIAALQRSVDDIENDIDVVVLIDRDEYRIEQVEVEEESGWLTVGIVCGE